MGMTVFSLVPWYVLLGFVPLVFILVAHWRSRVLRRRDRDAILKEMFTRRRQVWPADDPRG